MNVTLSVDDQVLERARELARLQGTSLNQLVREHLERLTARQGPAAALAQLEELWQGGAAQASGWTWNRDELHDRPVLR